MTELNRQQKAAAAKGQLGPSSLLAFWNTLSPVTSPPPRSQGKDFPTGLPPSRHYSFHRYDPSHSLLHMDVSTPPPPLSTQFNTQAYSRELRWQIQCPKITREKNDTPSGLAVPDLVVSDLLFCPPVCPNVAPDSHWGATMEPRSKRAVGISRRTGWCSVMWHDVG